MLLLLCSSPFINVFIHTVCFCIFLFTYLLSWVAAIFLDFRNVCEITSICVLLCWGLVFFKHWDCDNKYIINNTQLIFLIKSNIIAYKKSLDSWRNLCSKLCLMFYLHSVLGSLGMKLIDEAQIQSLATVLLDWPPAMFNRLGLLYCEACKDHSHYEKPSVMLNLNDQFEMMFPLLIKLPVLQFAISSLSIVL